MVASTTTRHRAMRAKPLPFLAVSVLLAGLGWLGCGPWGAALGLAGVAAGAIAAQLAGRRALPAETLPALDAVLGAVQAENRRLDDFLDTAPVGFFSVDA